MATVTLKGTEIQTSGTLPGKGTKAPDFTLCKGDLSDATLADYAGKKVVLNIFPSIDTGTCAHLSDNSTRKPRNWKTPRYFAFPRTCRSRKHVFVVQRAWRT